MAKFREILPSLTRGFVEGYLSRQEAKRELENEILKELIKQQISSEYKPEKKEENFEKKLLRVMAGVSPVTEVVPEEELPEAVGLGEAEGGQVLLPPGATYKEGQIFSPTGELIGEYLPGYEPKDVARDIVADTLRSYYGIPQKEAAREVFGIGKPSKLTAEEVRERTKARREVGREQDIIDLFEVGIPEADEPAYLERHFTDEEKEDAEYKLKQYNKIQEKYNLPRYKFTKVGEDDWILEEYEAPVTQVKPKPKPITKGDRRAVRWLQEHGAPVTQRNIEAVKEKFGW